MAGTTWKCSGLSVELNAFFSYWNWKQRIQNVRIFYKRVLWTTFVCLNITKLLRFFQRSKMAKCFWNRKFFHLVFYFHLSPNRFWDLRHCWELYPSLKRGQISFYNFGSSCLPSLIRTEGRDENLSHLVMRTDGLRLSLFTTSKVYRILNANTF